MPAIFALARYNEDGSLDDGFGHAGEVLIDLITYANGEEQITALAVDPRGKIVVGGYAREANGRSHFALARFKEDGHLDSSFGHEESRS